MILTCLRPPRRTLKNHEVLRFRDYFWETYFRNPAFLNKVEAKFGIEQRKIVEEMASHTLRRKILENN